MATTEADIVNLALLRIGEQQVIDSLDDPDPAAKVAKVTYPLMRDAVLASMWWRFATRRAILAQVSGAERTGWAYAYALPSDCLTAQELVGDERNPAADTAIPFELEDHITVGRLLLTDREDAEIRYTTKVTAVPRYPPLFVDALAWRLAAEFALSITKKPAVARDMMGQYQVALLQAATQEFRQAQPDVPRDSEFIRVR